MIEDACSRWPSVVGLQTLESLTPGMWTPVIKSSIAQAEFAAAAINANQPFQLVRSSANSPPLPPQTVGARPPVRPLPAAAGSDQSCLGDLRAAWAADTHHPLPAQWNQLWESPPPPRARPEPLALPSPSARSQPSARLAWTPDASLVLSSPSARMHSRGSSPLPSIHSPPQVSLSPPSNHLRLVRHGHLSPLSGRSSPASPHALDGEGGSKPHDRSSSVEVCRPPRTCSSPHAHDGDRSRSVEVGRPPRMCTLPSALDGDRSSSVEVRRLPRVYSSPHTLDLTLDEGRSNSAEPSRPPRCTLKTSGSAIAFRRSRSSS